MSTAVGLLALIGGVALVVLAADALVDGLLGVGRSLAVAPLVLTVTGAQIGPSEASEQRDR